MVLISINGQRIERGGDLIGYLEGTVIKDKGGNKLGYYEGTRIYNSAGEQLSSVEGNALQPYEKRRTYEGGVATFPMEKINKVFADTSTNAVLKGAIYELIVSPA